VADKHEEGSKGDGPSNDASPESATSTKLLTNQALAGADATGEADLNPL
jgi:hypothetical protein